MTDDTMNDAMNGHHGAQQGHGAQNGHQHPSDAAAATTASTTTDVATPSRAALVAATLKQVQTATALMSERIDPARWGMPDLFAEGCGLLAGKPKKGKTVLMVNCALAVAAPGGSGKALGHIPITEAGEVLYVAAEDNKRRMQKRLNQMLGDEPAPVGLHLVYTWPRLFVGGLDALDAWMEQHPRTRLIVLDTLEKVRSRPPTNSSTSVYQADYEALEQLSAWAGAHHVAVVVVHHLRKAASLEGDPLDEVSGSTGLTGAADNVIVMRRSPQGVTTLHRQGRDYDDDDVWTLVGDRAQLLWTLDPTAEGSGTGLQQMGEGVKRVVDLLRASEPAGLLSKEVCAACPKSDTAVVRMWLRRAVEHGLASQERVRGAYHVGPAALSAPPPASALSPGLSAVAARAPKEPPPRGSAQGVTSVTSVTSAATLAAPCSDVTPAPPECNTPLVPGVTSLEPLPAWAEDPNVTHVTDVTPSEQERWRNEAERGQDGVPDVTPPAVGCYIPSPPPPSSLTLVEVARQGTEDRAAYVDRLAALGVTEDDAEHFFLSPFFAERVTTRWRGERERALAAAAGGPGERADLGGGVERPAGDARVHAGAPQQHDREAGRHGDD